MTEKIIVSPQRVRCLGDVVDPKSVSDFDRVACTLASSTDASYGTVYSESFLAGSSLDLVYDGLIGSETESFTISATLKNASGTAISGASVYLVVNDGEPTSATTNSSGGASFTVSTSDVTDYRFRVYYTGTSSICGSTAYGHVCVGDVTGLELHGNKSVIQTDESVGLWAKLVGTGALKGAVVKFYEQWTPNIRLSAEANPIQTGDTIDLSAQLVDSDGSLVREAGHSVKFYAPFYKNKTTSSTTVNEDIGDEYIITTDNSINIGDGISGGIYLKVQGEDGILLRVVLPGQPSVLEVILDKPYISMNNGVLSYNDTSIDLTSYSSNIDWTNLYNFTGKVIVW